MISCLLNENDQSEVQRINDFTISERVVPFLKLGGPTNPSMLMSLSCRSAKIWLDLTILHTNFLD